MTSFTTVLVASLLSAGCGAESRNNADSDVSLTGDQRSKVRMIESLLETPLETIKGDTTTLANLGASAFILVNVASKCGYTSQYEGLEALYREYKDSRLVVVGFPANNFGGQEPGSNAEILSFCTSRFNVSFPMMAKVSVKGRDKHPLFVTLTENSSIPGEIGWNFEKFLLDREGQLIARFPSRVKPQSTELLSKLRPLLENGGA